MLDELRMNKDLWLHTSSHRGWWLVATPGRVLKKALLLARLLVFWNWVADHTS